MERARRSSHAGAVFTAPHKVAGLAWDHGHRVGWQLAVESARHRSSAKTQVSGLTMVWIRLTPREERHLAGPDLGRVATLIRTSAACLAAAGPSRYRPIALTREIIAKPCFRSDR